LRQDVFEQIIHKDVAFFDSRRTGDLISRLSSDTAAIEGAISTQVAMLLKSGLYCIIVIVMFFLISWKMTLFTLGIMLPTTIMGPMYGKFVKRIRKEISDAKAASSNVAEEAIANIRTVKAFATEELECTEYQKKNDIIYAKAKHQAFWYGGFSFFMQFIMFGSLDALVYFAAYLNSNDGLSIGDFTAFQFYMFSFLINFMQMTSVLSEVMGVFGTTAAIAEIFLHESKVNTTGGTNVTQESLDDGAIHLKEIQFKYPTRDDITVIQDVEIQVPKNKTVALVGTSGCGKSTII
jgi:ATP-binding cassette subfamily B protein